jgi:chemotaxis methyl-accepting protein methylase
MMVFRPSLSLSDREEILTSLLTRGVIDDPILISCVERLKRRFVDYLFAYRYPLWAPGLVIENEMRAMTDLIFPLNKVQNVLQRFLTCSLCYSPPSSAQIIFRAASWLDLAARLSPFVVNPDPSHLLTRLMVDEEIRRSFLFSVLVPRHHGGDFVRYPGQYAFLRQWLGYESGFNRNSKKFRCLDAACGDGTGTYTLLELLLEEGVATSRLEVVGSSIEPLELVSAACCYFPHAEGREAYVRRKVEPFFRLGATECLNFYQEDLRGGADNIGRGYRVIVCNGLLGGPIMHSISEIATVVKHLVERLESGGIILCANRFHEGWRKRGVERALAEIFRSNGLQATDAGEGVAGMLPRTG